MPGMQVLHKWKNKPLQQRLGEIMSMTTTCLYLTSCFVVRVTQGRGLMPDNTTRFKCKGKDIFHFVSSQSSYCTKVLADISHCRWGRRRSLNTPWYLTSLWLP